MTINRVELGKDTYAGLVAMRLPTAEEIAAAGMEGRREHAGADKRKGQVPQEEGSQVPSWVASTGPALAVARAGRHPAGRTATGHRR